MEGKQRQQRQNPPGRSVVLSCPRGAAEEEAGPVAGAVGVAGPGHQEAAGRDPRAVVGAVADNKIEMR